MPSCPIDGKRRKCIVRVNKKFSSGMDLLCRGGTAQRAQALYHGLFIRIQSLHKLRVVQRFFPVCWAHSLQRVQLPVHRLSPLRRHPLPFRKQFVSHLIAIFRRKLLPSVSPFPQSILLIGRQIVPFLQVLANLLLPSRRKILESLIVLHEALLLRRRLVAKILHPFRRQPSHAAPITSGAIRPAVRLPIRRTSAFSTRILSRTRGIRPIRTRFVRTSSARIGTRRGRRWMRG